MPVWQSIYEELKDKNFELISAAQDSGGAAAAARIYNDANVTYTAIIDVGHTISSLFGFVNVPSAAWIDEEGTIVRINEGTFAQEYDFGSMEVGSEDFAGALRDWVEKGSESVYAQAVPEVTAKLRPRTTEQARGEAAFKLAVHFHLAGDSERADRYWKQAQQANPESWNYHRQDWSFTPDEAGRRWREKFEALGDKPYYAPLDLPRTGPRR